MAEQNDILGISGQLDISDIISSVDKLYDQLSKIENISKETASEMERAFKAVGEATDKEVGEKASQALEVFKRALEEAKNGAEQNVTKIENSIERMQNKLAKLSVERTDTIIGSKTYDGLTRDMDRLNTQIQNQQKALAIARQEAESAGGAYNTFLSQVATASSAIDIFTASSAAGTVATGLNTGAHAAAAGAIGAEGVARVDNAKKIENENEKLDEQKKVLNDVADTLAQSSQQNTPIGASISTIEENLERLKQKNEELREASNISGVSNEDAAQLDARINQNVATIEKLEAELNRLKDIAGEGYKSVEEYEAKMAETTQKISPETAAAYWEQMKNIGERAQGYFDALPDLLERISGLLSSITPTPENEAFIEQMHRLVQSLGNIESADDFLTNQKESLSQAAARFEKLSDSEVQLQQMYEKQKQNTEEAKRTAQATGDIGKEADKSSTMLGRIKSSFKDMRKSVKDMFSDLKGGFTGGQGFSGIFKLLTSGKFLGWATAIGAVGGSIKELSEEAEKLRIALDPLRPYLDDDVLEKLRRSFIDTALNGSEASTEEMAASATRWVKYYEGIRKAPGAIQAVVDSSVQLSTITGQSVDKATEALTKLGGQFHQTAEEASKNVNVIVNATKNSTVKYDEMMSALTQSGARVNQNGATLKEFAAAISLSSAQYGSASQAASAYQRILQRLSIETNDNFNPKVVGATQAFLNLHKEMEKGTDLSKKFGRLLWSQAQYFIKNAETIAKYTDGLDDATGKQNALSAAEKKAENHKKQLKNAMAALAQSVNLNLTPALITVVDALTNIVSWCGQATTAVRDFFDGIEQHMKNNLSERWYDFWFKDFNALWNKDYKDAWRTKWVEKDTRKLYRKMLDKNNGIMGDDRVPTGNKLLKQYDNSKPEGLSREEIQNIIQEENQKWLANHQVLSTATTKGGGNELGAQNHIDDAARNRDIENQAEQRARLEEDIIKSRREREQEESQQRIAAVRAEEEAIIATLEDGAERERRERDLEHQKRLDEIESQRQQMIEKNIEYEAAEYNKKRGKGQKGFYARGLDKKVGLTADQQREIDALNEKENADYNLLIRNQYKQEADAMRSFLEEYGVFQQQKLAITEEYAEKIRKANSMGEKLSLEKERDEKLAEVEYKAIEQKIDWYSVFDNLGAIMKGPLEAMLNDLKDYVKSPQFQQLQPEQKQNVVNAMSNIRQSIGTTGDLDFHDLATSVREYQLALQEQENKQQEFDSVFAENIEGLEKAKKRLEEIVKTSPTDKVGIKAAKDEVERFQATINHAAVGLDDANKKVKSSGQNMATTAKDVITPVSEITTILQQSGIPQLGELFSALDKLKGGIDGLKALREIDGKKIGEAGEELADKTEEVGENLSDATKNAASKLGKALSKGGFIAQIISAILSILDILKDGVGTLVSNIIDTILKAISGIIENILSLEFVPQILGSVVSGIGGILNAVTLGGFNSWFGVHGNEKEVAETIDKLTKRNELLQKSIEDLTSEMEKSRGATAIRISLDAEKLQKETNQNYKEAAQAQADYHSAHHSFNYYWEGFSREQIERLSKQIGRSWNGDIWDLSPEEMKLLRSNVDMWEKIQNTGKGGYGERVAEKLNDYIEQAGKLQEIQDALYENLTTTTRDNVFDDFLGSLYDLADGAEDVFKNIDTAWQKMVNRMVINNLVGAKFQQKLNTWYEDLAKLNEQKTNGEISDEEYKRKLEELKKQYDNYVRDAEKEIQQFRENGIIQDTENIEDKSATYNSLEKWTYDQADEFIQRATALQIIDEHQYEVLQQSLNVAYATMQGVEGIRISAAEIVAGIQETIELHEVSNGKLDRIIANTAPISEIRDYVKKLYNER